MYRSTSVTIPRIPIFVTSTPTSGGCGRRPSPQRLVARLRPRRARCRVVRAAEGAGGGVEASAFGGGVADLCLQWWLGSGVVKCPILGTLWWTNIAIENGDFPLLPEPGMLVHQRVNHNFGMVFQPPKEWDVYHLSTGAGFRYHPQYL